MVRRIIYTGAVASNGDLVILHKFSAKFNLFRAKKQCL